MKKQWALVAVAAYLIFSTTNIFSSPIKPGKRVNYSVSNIALAEISGNIEYGFSKSSIKPFYYSKLNKLATYLIENRAALTLRGYADSIGSFKGNWKLSEKRAIVVKSYLIKKGVNNEKIITTAYGSTEPISTNSTAQGRQKNRRVEIKVNPIN
jgi:outer membrane protein OmpA-like peptidoglycan-associated protein